MYTHTQPHLTLENDNHPRHFIHSDTHIGTIALKLLKLLTVVITRANITKFVLGESVLMKNRLLLGNE